MKGSVVVEKFGALARVALSHPGKLNAMSRGMWRELRSVFDAIQQDATIRCILIRGEGGNFCAGGDISEYSSFRFEESSLCDFHEVDVWGGLQAMLDCDVPIVACIEGNCLGAGLEIASCCDIRIAESAARFGAPIAKLGFPMAPREAALVARALGELPAREMLLSASVLGAAEMKQRGFLNKVVEGPAMEAEICALVDHICKLAPAAAHLNKQTLRALGHSLPTLYATDLVANAYAYAANAEHREGVTAFIEKRVPEFATRVA